MRHCAPAARSRACETRYDPRPTPTTDDRRRRPTTQVEQVLAVQLPPGAKELSTYAIRIVPALGMLTQRRNYRIFQHKNIPDIIDALLDE